MAKDIHDPAAVTAYLQNLEPAQGIVAETVRQVFLQAHPTIGEQIKWNAPSFFYTGEMPAFDAKTYQRDLAVMHLRKGPVMLVFPNGASLEDPTGILEGKYTDGRRMLTLKSVEDVEKCKAALEAMVRKWAEGIARI
ncbi:MAG: DUF1801 domain-containing protein [Saprospiraceae bacterium]|nr:DUF1801 domain-containing protein [Saprospiraceae bacterium]